MNIRIIIETGNAAFEDCPEVEVSRILKEIVSKLEWDQITIEQGESVKLRDVNGNVVGMLDIE